MTPADAARILGVRADAPWDQVRQAYRAQIRVHHPDAAGAASSERAASITEAYRILTIERDRPSPRPAPPTDPPATGTTAGRGPAYDVEGPPNPGRGDAWWSAPPGDAPPVHRLDGDTLVLDAPSDETFRWLLDAAHDVGEVTYVDRSMPIMEVLCRFEGEPATSLVLTLQGRGLGTEVFCTAESIEARPAPPTSAVVDLLELALHRRRTPAPPAEGDEPTA